MHHKADSRIAGGISIILMLLACSAVSAAVSPDDTPVVVRGSMLPALEGTPVSEIGLFCYSDDTESFLPIPFQLDERIAHTFYENQVALFTEVMYDIYQEDNGLLDDEDEIVFLYGDACGLAPEDADWPEGADNVRIRLAASDDRPGGAPSDRWVYLFTGTDLPAATTSYIIWDTTATGDILTDRMSMEYDGNWLLTGFRIFPPCGTGEDLIDRVKGRARTITGAEEDEEIWSQLSTYLGGIAGPVRAIRYVKGAASASNTIHHDIVYRSFWHRVLNLRVHPLDMARTYIDWRPRPGLTYYSPERPDGVSIDGQVDAVPATFVSWSLVRSPAGGIVILNDVPLNPLYGERREFYRDDDQFDDEIRLNPDYGDEDDASYGSHGIELINLANSHTNSIHVALYAYPLCMDIGDGTVGGDYYEFLESPFGLGALPEVRDLTPLVDVFAIPDLADIVLEWPEVPGALTYEVHRTSSPELPKEAWTQIYEGPTAGFRDIGAAADGNSYFYFIEAE